MKYNYKPLTTFRGWGLNHNQWIYGGLVTNGNETFIIDSFNPYGGGFNGDKVDKDSIGIYTGRGDENGTPIFCGVDGALYGGDIVRQEFLDTIFSDPIISIGCVAYGDSAFFQIDELNQTTNPIMSTSIVTSTQYEQHLKENSK